jgi:hypothetical protein
MQRCDPDYELLFFAAERGAYLELEHGELNLKQAVTLCSFQVGTHDDKMPPNCPHAQLPKSMTAEEARHKPTISY